MIHKTWTTAELRVLSSKIGRPPYDQVAIDQAKAALLVAADLIDAADFVIAESNKPQEGAMIATEKHVKMAARLIAFAQMKRPAQALKPCPFCGVSLIANDNPKDFHVARYGTHYEHPNGTTCHMDRHEVAPSEVDDWNKRTPDAALLQHIEALEADARGLKGRQGVLVDLLRECVGPLEVSAAIIESDDCANMELLIDNVKATLETFDSAAIDSARSET